MIPLLVGCGVLGKTEVRWLRFCDGEGRMMDGGISG